MKTTDSWTSSVPSAIRRSINLCVAMLTGVAMDVSLLGVFRTHLRQALGFPLCEAALAVGRRSRLR